MPRLFLLTLFLAFFAGIVFAQGSPFGDYSEAAGERFFTSVDDINTVDYINSKESYEDLNDLYGSAYGTRKEELSVQIVLRAKDVLVSKLGAVKSFFQRIVNEATSSNRMSEEAVSGLNPALDEYTTKAEELAGQVEGKGSVEDLDELSATINEEATNTFNLLRAAIYTVNVARGEHIIDLIEEEIPVVFAHINASASLGGDVRSAKDGYDTLNLKLESAKDSYANISVLLSEDSIEFSDIKSEISRANNDLSDAYENMENVIKELRILYSNSPWELDETEFRSVF